MIAEEFPQLDSLDGLKTTMCVASEARTYFSGSITLLLIAKLGKTAHSVSDHEHHHQV